MKTKKFNNRAMTNKSSKKGKAIFWMTFITADLISSVCLAAAGWQVSPTDLKKSKTTHAERLANFQNRQAVAQSAMESYRLNPDGSPRALPDDPNLDTAVNQMQARMQSDIAQNASGVVNPLAATPTSGGNTGSAQVQIDPLSGMPQEPTTIPTMPNTAPAMPSTVPDMPNTPPPMPTSIPSMMGANTSIPTTGNLSSGFFQKVAPPQ